MGEELLIFFVLRVNNFWFFPVMNGQEERIFWGFGCCCFPAKKLFEARHWTFPVACLVRFWTQRSSVLIVFAVWD